MMRQFKLVEVPKYKALFQKKYCTAFSRTYLHNCLKTVQEWARDKKTKFSSETYKDDTEQLSIPTKGA